MIQLLFANSLDLTTNIEKLHRNFKQNDKFDLLGQEAHLNTKIQNNLVDIFLQNSVNVLEA